MCVPSLVLIAQVVFLLECGHTYTKAYKVTDTTDPRLLPVWVIKYVRSVLLNLFETVGHFCMLPLLHGYCFHCRLFDHEGFYSECSQRILMKFGETNRLLNSWLNFSRVRTTIVD